MGFRGFRVFQKDNPEELQDAARSNFRPPAQDIVSWRIDLEITAEEERDHLGLGGLGLRGGSSKKGSEGFRHLRRTYTSTFQDP